jgi:alcohol dehydrogenase
MGHEFVGVVEATGDAVTGVRTGDLVIAPFVWSDGTCDYCVRDLQTSCRHGGGFGGTDEQGRLVDGGQGEYVRVPQADGTLVPVPGGDVDEALVPALLSLSDVMGTGHHAALAARVRPGSTVAVVGDGAVGLCAVLAARRLGAERVIAMSRHESRQELARRFGATDVVAERGEAGAKAVAELLGGIGADAVLECVGTKESTETAFAIARAGAIVGRVGVPHDARVDAEGTFYRNVGMRGGPAPARHYQPQLLEAVLAGEINPGKVFDLTTDLDHIAEAYAAMDERRAIKSLIKVSELA